MTTTPNREVRAVVAAVDRLTTQVRRLADAKSTPVVVGEMETVGTCDASTHGLGAATLGPCILRYQHDGPVHQDETGVRWSTAVAAADDAPTTTADDDTLRFMRRESLLVLLTRLQRGRALTEDEAGTLRHHVETEIREANTARAELEQAQAAIERVRALRDPIAEAIEQADYSGSMRRGDLADSVMPVILAALDGTNQPAGCPCHTSDERCSGCGRCPNVCHGCDGTDQPTTKEN
ncbi:hypothetical protein [Streptomyces coelicoflavus]|uniref:hypothetical protein n=1 Tax=Streptomyces coelicoflavus TaxID=285562 RepID=UPI00362B13D7